LRTGPKLGLSPPSRTLPLSTVLAGAKRTGPKLGLSPPNLTLPLSTVLAGAKRTGPKLGLSPPSLTLPASATLAGVGATLTVKLVSCLCIIMLSFSEALATDGKYPPDATSCSATSCDGSDGSVGVAADRKIRVDVL
jgi:hypothetical protein